METKNQENSCFVKCVTEPGACFSTDPGSPHHTHAGGKACCLCPHAGTNTHTLASSLAQSHPSVSDSACTLRASGPLLLLLQSSSVLLLLLLLLLVASLGAELICGASATGSNAIGRPGKWMQHGTDVSRSCAGLRDASSVLAAFSGATAEEGRRAR